MQSVSDITIGKPQMEDVGITVPLMVNFSDDDSDNDLPPWMQWASLQMFIPYSFCAHGEDHLRTQMMATVEAFMSNYGPITRHRIRAAFEAYLEKHTFSQFGNRYIPEPSSYVRH